MNSITDNWTGTPAPLTQGRPHRYCLILKSSDRGRTTIGFVQGRVLVDDFGSSVNARADVRKSRASIFHDRPHWSGLQRFLHERREEMVTHLLYQR